MVIAAVGVVSIPSGLIASGFVEIVQSKNRARRGGGGNRNRVPQGGRAGDDWYEIQYRALANVEPPASPFGPTVDQWQIKVNEFLNGKDGLSGRARKSGSRNAARRFSNGSLAIL